MDDEKKVKAVFFDLGNVIVRFDVGILSNILFPGDTQKADEIEKFVMDSPDMNRYMEGELTSSRFYSRVKKRFNLKLGYRDFYEAWNGIFFPYPEVEEIIRSLKEKYPEIKLVLVSNTNETHFNFIEKEYDIITLFDEKILSHEVGCQKPDNEIFSKALAASDTLPRDTFYTDDRADLIEAARVMGLRAFQFISHDKLRSDLARVNILL